MEVVGFRRISQNAKLGGLPATMTSWETCPPSCPLRGNGCYAECSPMWFGWRNVTNGRGVLWPEFLGLIRALPEGQAWRHCQAGDLSGVGERLSVEMLGELSKANRGRRGFTYTHKRLEQGCEEKAVREANRRGFAVNVSANNLKEADEWVKRKVGPVVTLVAADAVLGDASRVTPEGRVVRICPSMWAGSTVTCSACLICTHADRDFIVGFYPHGSRKKKVAVIAAG